MSLVIIAYLADIVQGVKGVLVFIFAGVFFIGGVFLYGGIYYDEYKDKKLGITILISSCFILILVGLIPSKEGIYTMVGVSNINKVSETPEAQKALKIINLGLDKAIANLQESK